MRNTRALHAAIEGLELRRLLAAYAPDVSFGNGGATNALGRLGIAEQGGGKLLVSGYKQVFDDPEGGGDFNHTEYFQTRLNADGTIDQTFGVNGTKDVTDAQRTKIGSRYFLYNDDYYASSELVAQHADGSIDTSFSADGKLPLPYVNRRNLPLEGASIRELHEAPEGGDRMFVHFQIRYRGTNHRLISDDELVKLKADGSVDTSFGTGGYLQLKAANVSTTVSAQGIYTFGWTVPNNTLQRFRLDGRAYDKSFGGGDGIMTLPGNATSLKVRPDGKIYYATYSAAGNDSHPEINRLNVDGSTDTGFGDGGRVDLYRADTGFFYDVNYIFDDQNRIWTSASNRLFRLSTNGQIDAAPFNGTLPFTDGAMMFDSNDRLIVGRDNSVTRYDFADPIEVGRDNVLYLYGDSGDDTASVTLQTDGRLHARMNGAASNPRAKPIKGVVIRTFDGNNNVTVNTDSPVTIETGAGDDTIATGDEDDTIQAGEGSNTISIGAGNDSVSAHYESYNNYGQADVHRITGGNGDKSITTGGGAAVVEIGTGDSHVSVGRNGSAGDQTVHIAGGNNTVSVGGGFDAEIQINGSGKNTIDFGIVSHGLITTGEGDDTIETHQNAKVVSRGGDDEIIIAGAGSRGTLVVDGGEGNDLISVRYAFDTPSGTLMGGAGNDRITAGDGACTIDGGSGNDVIKSGEGNDYITGGSGNDVIRAGAGDDELYGNSGKDTIYGEDGNDLMIDIDKTKDSFIGGGGRDRAKGDRKLDLFDAGVETVL